MTTHNANNERIKRRYFAYLKEAMRHSEPTLDAVAKALVRFEADTKYRDFKAFHFEQAIAFKRHLTEQKNQQTGEKLARRPCTPRWPRSNASSTGSPGKRATSRVFNIQMPTISICLKRTCVWRPRSVNRWGQQWSRRSTSSP